ncbi:MAG: Peptidoglycan glycosyltransferase [Clostridia bacterium 41_269]|nr:MAG: Peptidoglycan glycosyltransferase [Clostridia bacterium 41_269]
MATSPYNRRLAAIEEKIPRGTIYDRNGKVLAETRNGKRIYPLGRDAVHVIGFISRRYGRTGLERVYDQHLLGISKENELQSIINKLLGRVQKGNDIVVTLDAALQEKASDLLGNRKGAVVALDPRTGDILVLASSPSFDPENLEEKATGTSTRYDLLLKDNDSPLINRATQGAYPPGSTFKLVTGGGMLTSDPTSAYRSVNCRGEITVEGFTLPDIASHGITDFDKAIALSCNTFFATGGLELGAEKLYEAAEAFGITKNPWEGKVQEVPCRPGTLTPPNKMSKAQIASTAIGQGELLVSPLHMALVAAAVANDGIIMRPHLLDRVQTQDDGEIIIKYTPEEWLEPIGQTAARILKRAMVKAVEEGTAARAAIPGITVAGKTGSAQNPSGAPHAWFVGFAPAEEPRIAVAVIIENGGAGGSAAAPIAREIMKMALKIEQ